MILRKITIFFIIGLFLAGFCIYVVNNFSPFNEDKIQELINEKEIEEDDWDRLSNELNKIIDDGFIFEYLTTNAYLALGLALGSIFCLFVSLHLSIDKLFFKKYFEPASLFDAVRRGFILALALGSFVILNLYNADVYTLASIPIVAALIEIFAFLYIRNEVYRKLRKIREEN